MGLESINYLFHSGEEISAKIDTDKDLIQVDQNQYVYKKEGEYWIDLEIQNNYSLSIRVTLSNPTESVLRAMNDLFLYLFAFKGAVLIDIRSKKKYNHYDKSVKEDLIKSYMERKSVFKEMYGDYTAAISSEEFYKRQHLE